MVHPSRSILPKWYAEDKFLETEAISATSDTTHSFVFGRMFKTPSNRTYRDGNHLRIGFCHLEFPYDCNGCLAEPPSNIAQTVTAIYNRVSPASSAVQHRRHDAGAKEKDEDEGACVLARCVVDYTVQPDAGLVDGIVRQFAGLGYRCERGLEDTVMRLVVEDGEGGSAAGSGSRSGRLQSRKSQDPRPVPTIRKLAGHSMIPQLVDCNARAFGYDATGDTAWLHAKLARQLDQPDAFSVYAAVDGTASDARVLSFAIIYRAPEKAPHLAFVQAVATAPEHRRRGLASDVIQYAVDQLSPGTRVYLEACEPHAISLYQGVGFEEVGRVRSTECILLK
ncbi:hypothetical protein H4217_004472 [Coemansia sp. RSA 1939]|nr:hypothetical protein H4217_004472 [Coemansia sp. RSA 1939]KAJ2616425.1 hypothetical protein EV177_001076 [Coemansia sp. RSA 1804]